MPVLSEVESAVAAHLRSAVSGVRVYEGSPNHLRADKILRVEATDVTWSPHRDVVEVEVECLGKAPQPSVGDKRLTELLDGVYAAAQTLQGAIYWAGVGTLLEAESSDELLEVDVAQFAVGTVRFTVHREHVIDREIGESEQAVIDLLAAAGVSVVNSADHGKFVLTRWTGSAPDDPYVDEVRVYVAAPAESGEIEQFARHVWRILYTSEQVTITEPLSMDPAGQPPGSQAAHSTVEIVCRVLNIRDDGESDGE